VTWRANLPKKDSDIAPRREFVLDRARERDILGELMMRANQLIGKAARSTQSAIVLAVVVLIAKPTAGWSQTVTAGGIPAVSEVRTPLGGEILPISCQNCSTPSTVGSSPGILGWGKHNGPLACDIGCIDPGCGEAGCAAGHPACETCSGQHWGRLFCALHDALCCPDPCYEPRWIPAANAAFFIPSVRPTTYTRFRWDYGNNLTQPDRNEYFWAAIGLRGPANAETRVNYHELSMYAEVGTEKFSFFINTPYRNLNPTVNTSASGFGDLTLGTKSVLIDSELVLTTFQFATTIPTGLSGRGLGAGHVSLEPSLLYAVKLYTDTYWQGQIGYWIPIGGTAGVAGGAWFYNNSLNHVLWRPLKDTALIGTFETTGITWNSGGATGAAVGTILNSRGVTYFGVGPGIRLSVCDRVDFGFGVQFAITNDHLANQLYRTELRWRF
jgi:hypothetical protein